MILIAPSVYAHNKMKRFLIIDDQFLFRYSLRNILQNAVSQCEIFEVENIGAGIGLLKTEHFDLVTMDITAKNHSKTDLIKILTCIANEANVIIITNAKEELYVKLCLQAGIRGFIHKSASQNDVVTAISTVLNGKLYVSDNVHRLLLDNKIS